MHVLVCKCSWCSRYLWRGHVLGAASVFLFPVLHLCFDSIISIFLLGTWWQCSWGAHTRTSTQRPPSSSTFIDTHTQSKNATLQLFCCQQLVLKDFCFVALLWNRFTCSPPVDPRGAIVGFNMSCLMVVSLPPPSLSYFILCFCHLSGWIIVSEAIRGQQVINLSENSLWTKTLSAQMKMNTALVINPLLAEHISDWVTVLDTTHQLYMCEACNNSTYVNKVAFDILFQKSNKFISDNFQISPYYSISVF